MLIESIAFILATTLMYSAPLIFTALGGLVSENAGVVNIGLEGMMTLGAFVGAAVGYFANDAWVGFLAAGLSGGFLALFHAVACVTFMADHIVSGIAMNFIGPGLALFLSRYFFDGATQTLSLSLDAKIPRPFNGVFEQNGFFDMVFNQYATVYIALLMVLLVWFVLYRTRIGLRIRAVGEHPKAADTLGIDVFGIKYMAVVVSGVLAGFGGAALSVAIVSRFSATLVSGQGFIALAAMIFGKWRPGGTLSACLLFSSAQGLTVFMGRADMQRLFPIPSQLLAMIPFLLTLAVLIGFVGKSTPPAADGLPYEKE
ncbi:MAG: ABC transporter permease [Synergistaceae bacterium]|nr:ABC transporter permease [Synergistota bacterium]NLM70667.1 ABC transporter permease [Synergistaceae bacterium]